MDVQFWAAILFVAALSIFLYSKRRKLQVQKLLFPLLYFVMYKTQIGVKAMDKIAKKYGKIILALANFIIFIGFLGMAFILFELGRSLYKLITSPEALPGVGIIQPFVPNVPGTIFVPFFYFIISIFIIAVIHEFSHGVMARTFKCKIKSSGFAFLGVILPIVPAAFVEPDEKQLAKRPAKHQLALFAAGPFANIVLALIILGVFAVGASPVSSAMMDLRGIEIISVVNETELPAFKAGIQPGELILEMDSVQMESADNFTMVLDSRNPGDRIKITTNKTTYAIMLAEHPEQPGKAYLGIVAAPKYELKAAFIQRYGNIIPKVLLWFFGLLYWLFILNLGIGLFNLVPLGPIDGGRMLRTALNHFFEQKKADKIWIFISFVTFSVIFLNIVVSIWR